MHLIWLQWVSRPLRDEVHQLTTDKGRRSVWLRALVLNQLPWRCCWIYCTAIMSRFILGVYHKIQIYIWRCCQLCNTWAPPANSPPVFGSLFHWSRITSELWWLSTMRKRCVAWSHESMLLRQKQASNKVNFLLMFIRKQISSQKTPGW